MRTFILSLPRSGTSWLTTWLMTIPEVMAYHELASQCIEYTDFKAAIYEGKYRHTVVADHFNLYMLDRLREDFPDARFVGLVRKLPDVRESLVAAIPGQPKAVLEGRLRNDDAYLFKALEHCDGVIAYDQLFTEAGMRVAMLDIFDEPVPLEPAKFRQAVRLRVEPMYLHPHREVLANRKMPWHTEILQKYHSKLTGDTP